VSKQEKEDSYAKEVQCDNNPRRCWLFGSIESRTTPYQEEEDDVHMPSLTSTTESRTTPFQEEEHDVHMPSHTYITELRTTPFQEEEDDVDIP
jgi:hypothetical protein